VTPFEEGHAVGWGILSTARINRPIVAAAKRSELAELRAIASRDRARAEAYARENEVTRAYGSYEGLLDDPDVEAVYISLPNSLHVEWSIRALEAGKHVLCEKPLSRRASEVEEAFSVSERSNKLLMEAFMYRHNPQTLKLKELVDGGAVGPLRLVRAAFSFSLKDTSNIRLNAELDGGALMDVGCYCVSASRLVAGEPERVFGEQLVHSSGVDQLFSGMMVFPNGVLAEFDSALCLPARHELEVIGEDASLFLGDPWHCRSPGIELRTAESREQISMEAVDSYQLQLDNFSAAVWGNAPPLLGREDAVGQARTIEALYGSAEAGRPLPLV
jgi:xylose dehydrogenase (NAD/NADP)